jgi:hypothetical protein
MQAFWSAVALLYGMIVPATTAIPVTRARAYIAAR